ncbi:MAG: phosphoribosylglycinamide formyltransferase [Bacteroidetes bacterium]|nr:phosphoribosylglycinamide formyltransferase [Bacteroidota bacterium]
MNKVAVFASGSGTNAENLVNYFSNHESIRVALILTNKPDAGVIERAKKLDVPCIVFNKTMFRDEKYIPGVLQNQHIDWIVLAGFLWLVPSYLIKAFPGRIVNIHPSLLPKYGGKGMYGQYVHQAVLDNNETETGITVHYVNNEYDRGEVIFQKKCAVLPDDNPESLASRVHQLEYDCYPKVVESLILNKKK